MEKRESCRAIIFDKDKMVVMYREKNDRVYYTFPGGGRNEGETLEDCVKREVLEEFGLNVEPVKEVYTYENPKTYQHFYLCNWVSGELGTGEGEEFQGDVSRGVYIPMLVDTNRLSQIPLMPPEVTAKLVEDLKVFGQKLDSKLTYIEGE
jgi:ADP-ribose pyrophosphatase YjhB (NUDIX family)